MVAKQATLIYNPAAGGRRDRGATARRIAHILEDANFTVEVAHTESHGHAEELARQAGQAKIDAVFSYGGDGTLRECAAGLLGSDTALGFLPGGTANVMTRVLGLPQDPLAAARLLASAQSMLVDVGMCNDRPILMQASAGLDAEVLARLNPGRKRWLGKAEVGLSFAAAWWSFSYPEFEVSWSGHRRLVTFAAVCNIPFYGGPWRLAPQARWNNGLLDLVMFTGRGRASTLGFARDLLIGRHVLRPDVEIVRVESVDFAAAEGLKLQIDGDSFNGSLPCSVRLATEQIRFLTPGPAIDSRRV
jgi:YegS/Rv2252/BmrU family lipid kinase